MATAVNCGEAATEEEPGLETKPNLVSPKQKHPSQTFPATSSSGTNNGDGAKASVGSDGEPASNETLVLRFKPVSDINEMVEKDSSVSGFCIESSATSKGITETSSQEAFDRCEEKHSLLKNTGKALKRSSNELCMTESTSMTPLSNLQNDTVQNESCLKVVRTEDCDMRSLKCKENRENMHDNENSGYNSQQESLISKTSDSENTTPVPSFHEQVLSNVSPDNTNLPHPIVKDEDSLKEQDVEFAADSVAAVNEYEEVLECGTCKLLFKDQYSYIDHVYQCQLLAPETGDSSDGFSEDNMDEDYSYSKVESTEEHTGNLNEFEQKSASETFIFSCPNCDKNFYSLVVLKIHMQTCKRPGTDTNVKKRLARAVNCAKCHEEFYSEWEYSQHLVSVHVLRKPDKKRNLLDLEETEFQDLSTQEGKQKLSFKCFSEDCIKTFDTAAELKAHFSSHTQFTENQTTKNVINKSNKPLEGSTDSTGESVSKNGSIKKESKEITTKDKGQCKAIKKRTEESERVKTDKKEMSSTPASDKSDKVYQCEEKECGCSFKSERLYRHHVKLVHKENNGIYKCQNQGCNIIFFSKDLLKQHVRAAHMEPSLNKPTPENETVHQCQNKGCGLLFETKALLKEHIKDVHMVSGVTNLTHPDLMTYICLFCVSSFETQVAIEGHLERSHGVSVFENMYIIERKTLCKFCSCYMQSNKILEHYRSCRKQKVPVKGPTKSKESVANYTELKKQKLSHNENVLSQKRKASLGEIDDKASATKKYTDADSVSELLQFKEMDNLDKQKLSTDTLSTSSISDSHPVRLETMYTYEFNTFRCNLCPFAFLQKSVIINHLVEVHGLQPPKYICSYESCSANFTRENEFLDHLKEHVKTGNEGQFVFDVKNCGLKFKHLQGRQNTKKCSLCQFRYFHKDHYKVHLLEKHGKAVIESNERDNVDCHGQFSKSIMLDKSISRSCSKMHTGTGSEPRPVKITKTNVPDPILKDDGPNAKLITDGLNVVCVPRKMGIKVQDNHQKMFQKQESDSEETGFTCLLCNLTFPNRNKLAYHLVLQHKHTVNVYTCKWEKCTAFFVTAEELKLHVKNHFSQSNSVRGQGNGTVASGSKSDNINQTVRNRLNIYCPYCHYRCYNEQLYEKHMLKKHSNRQKQDPFQAEGTVKVATNKNDLELDSNLLPYKCSVEGCSKAFLYRRDLIKHSQISGHGKEVPKQNKVVDKDENVSDETKIDNEMLYTVDGFDIELMDV